MIPAVNDDLQADFEFVEMTSHTYKLNANKETISGYIDELNAVRQAIYLALNVERYAHIIYDWNYGVETHDLFGQPTSYVIPELKRRITEALTQDTRILSVDNFKFEVNKNKVIASFTANTIFGTTNILNTVVV